jgi:NADP-dependent 3-hydroxy acid dehydrogenase YdfG
LKAENAQELQKLAETNSNIHVLEFDMTDVSGPRLPELVKQVSDIVQESGLNLLINNAGMNLKETFDEV